MARFRGTTQGNRGEASRLGYDSLETTCNGWNIGVRCVASVDSEGNDVIDIYKTGGSSYDSNIERIGCVKL